RIQQYTLCVEPLGGPGARGQNASVNVSWLGQPEETFRGVARPRSQGLFRRAYDYVPDASGLVGVPIQVWATKSFESRWEVAPTQRRFECPKQCPALSRSELEAVAQRRGDYLWPSQTGGRTGRSDRPRLGVAEPTLDRRLARSGTSAAAAFGKFGPGRICPNH